MTGRKIDPKSILAALRAMDMGDFKPASRKFTNELGNHIEVRVETAEPIRGVPQISVRMIGPKSESENIVTEMEGRVLLEVLGTAFARGNA